MKELLKKKYIQNIIAVAGAILLTVIIELFESAISNQLYHNAQNKSLATKQNCPEHYIRGSFLINKFTILFHQF